jgi:hypothetical protein
MKVHSFMLLPGKWIGEGKICLNMVEEELIFFTRWTISPEDSGCIECKQEIEVKGLSDLMINYFRITNINSNTFILSMENHAVGKVEGKGVISESRLGWEFRDEELGFEGFESYEKQDDDSYLMQAEFSTNDQLRTTIKGKIWKPIAL